MSYIINKTDGTVLTEIIDGSIDQTATDLTLVGKNATTYGEVLNENFVHILENFANTSQPNNPIQGQLWFDTGESRLKVYDGSGFKVSGGTIVANSVPSSIAQGDIWIDSLRRQLYFNDGVSTMLAGPGYTAQQGVSGLQTISVTDTNDLTQTVSLLYVGGSILGLFSKTEFTPIDANQIPEFSGDVKVGFNVSTYGGVKFNVPVTQADYLLDSDGVTLRNADSFVSSTNDAEMLGLLAIKNATPLILGLNQNNEIQVSTNLFSINSNITNQNFEINVLSDSTFISALHITSQDRYVGIFTDNPTEMLDVNGNTRIRGDLIVEGSTTTINTTNIEIEDLLIELGKVETPSDSTAQGGGILLAGGLDGDKTLTWDATAEAWVSSENININSGNVYKIGNFEVLSQTTLGTTVTNAPGLNSIGTLSQLQVDNININDNIISFVNVSVANSDIVLAPKGTGSVDVSSKKITSLADATDSTDAVNLSVLQTNVKIAPIGLSINVGALSDSQIITNILDKIYPTLADGNDPSQLPGTINRENGTQCRVWCIDTNTAKIFTVVSYAWSFTANI